VCCSLWYSFAGFVTQNDYLSLDGQIQHKLAYIFDYIPADKHLILIGHSIGCYMILEMLSAGTKYSLAQSGNKVKKCYLLFPTIERLAQSPKGQFFTPLLKYFRWIVPLFTLPMLFLPHRVKQFLIGRYFGLGQVPQCAVEATTKLLSPTACRNCLYLANIEMHSVRELDAETIFKHLEQLCFYYGANDAWCPTEYHDSMKRLFPSGEIYLCSNGIQHAFVLNSSDHMAVIVSDWIESIWLVHRREASVVDGLWAVVSRSHDSLHWCGTVHDKLNLVQYHLHPVNIVDTNYSCTE